MTTESTTGALASTSAPANRNADTLSLPQNLSEQDAEIFAWADQYWPDLARTWVEYSDYYVGEFNKARRNAQLRASQGALAAGQQGLPF